MPIERYFIDQPFPLHNDLEIEGAEFHHLVHVMRTRKGDLIELVNGRGGLAQARVEDLKKNKAAVRIENVFQEDLKPQRIILAQALPKPQRLDFILEKGTELGVDSFWLFPGQLSIKNELFPQQLERARNMTIAAMKQCGRLTLPSIVIKSPLDQWSKEHQKIDHAFFGDLASDAPFFEEMWTSIDKHSFPLIFITGPESGFHEQEIDRMKNLGVRGVKLHNNILRTDTASIMAISLISHWLMSHKN